MRKAYIIIAILLVLAPLFTWAAEKVNYSEPLENAAEETKAKAGESMFSGIFPDYTVFGTNPYISAFIAGLIGCLIILLIVAIGEKVKNG